MATMLSEVYEAFHSTGVSEEVARKAAEAMAMVEPRFTKIEADLTALRGDLTSLRGEVGKLDVRLSRVEGDVQKLQTDMTLLKWMVGGLYAIITLTTVPMGWLLVKIAFKVGVLP